MSTITVLLIEPDADNRTMYEDGLRFEGLDVLATDNGCEGLEMAAAVDVIVTELRLRGPMNAAELIGRMRARYPDTAIVIVTSYALPPDRTTAEHAAADAVLLKPCVPAMLAGEIRRLLLERRPAADEAGWMDGKEHWRNARS